MTTYLISASDMAIWLMPTPKVPMIKNQTNEDRIMSTQAKCWLPKVRSLSTNGGTLNNKLSCLHPVVGVEEIITALTRMWGKVSGKQFL